MNGRNPAARDRTGGYLLIEALAVLIVSALVLTSLLSLGGSLSRSIERTQVRVAGAETDGRAVEAAARDIGLLVRRRFSGDGNRFVFVGEPDRILFPTARRDGEDLRDAVVVVYQAAERGGLMRAEGELPVLASGLSDIALSRPARLASRGARIRFSYIGRDDSRDGSGADRWRDPSALPEAVRIERRDPRTGRLIASRLVPVASRAEPGCAEPEMAFCSVAGSPVSPIAASGGAGR